MIIIIQCAAKKRNDAGHLATTSGKPVLFVADPQAAPTASGYVYAHPDDLSDIGISWRQALARYNENAEGNPLRLSPAYQLYENKTYQRLVDRFGAHNVCILSAGWGLIRAEFLTPKYDITYSRSALRYARRRKTDRYQDFCMLHDDIEDEIVFFGGKDYLLLFASLTKAVRCKKTAFYNSGSTPHVPNCMLKQFRTNTRTNWHYECANAFINETIDAPFSKSPK